MATTHATGPRPFGADDIQMAAARRRAAARWREKVLEWTRGDEVAAAFVEVVGEISQVLDDLADETLDRKTRETLSARAAHLMMVGLPNNAFYLRFQRELVALLDAATTRWALANALAESPRLESRMTSYVLRESLEPVVAWVAGVVGGHEHALAVAKDLHEFFYCEFGRESFGEWTAEEGAGAKATTPTSPEARVSTERPGRWSSVASCNGTAVVEPVSGDRLSRAAEIHAARGDDRG